MTTFKNYVLAASAVALATLAMPGSGVAQITGSAPYCVRVYTSSNIIERCEYASFAQCKALTDGLNNTCFENPYYQPRYQQYRR